MIKSLECGKGKQSEFFSNVFNRLFKMNPKRLELTSVLDSTKFGILSDVGIISEKM